MCPSCQKGDHTHCYDGDIVREELESRAIFTDKPVPWFGCCCECEDGVLTSRCTRS